MNPATAFAEGGYPAAAATDGAATSDDDGASTASGSSEGNATQDADEDESTADGTREGAPAGGELSHRAASLISTFNEYRAEFAIGSPVEAPEEASAGTAGGANGGSSASDVVSGSDFMTDDGGEDEDRGGYAAKDTMGSYESAAASERSGGPALLPSASRRSFYPPAPSDRQMRFMEEQLDAMDSEMSELSFGTAGAWGNESAARGPGVRYRHAASLLRGKRTRRALCTVIVAAVVVAVSTKLARMNKESHLPDWEKELADEQLVEESVAVAKHDKEVHDQIMKEEGGYKLDLPFGGSHVHGNAGNGQPSSSAGDIVNSVIQDAKANGGGEQSAASSQEQMGIPEISAEEAFVGQHYDPRWYDRNSGWAGATHSDAFDFCTSRRSVTCPYEAYCPGGVARPPFGSSSGFLNDYLSLKEGSWAPTGNGDEWVQLSDQNDDVCRVSSMPGFGNGEQTGHLLCCKLAMPETGGGGTAAASAPESPPETPVHNNGQTPPQGWIEVESQNRPEAVVDRGDEIKQELEAEASEADAARWHPVWFDRDSGWTGKTHGEADGFCDGQGGMIVCPYDAYCPSGPSGGIFGGPQDGPGGAPSYAPVNDRDGWVQVSSFGSSGRCALMSSESFGNEEQTRHVLCCSARQDVEGGGGDHDEQEHTEQAGPSPGGGSAASYFANAGANQYGSGPDESAEPDPQDGGKAPSEHENLAIQYVEWKYTPVIYGRSDGWDGVSHGEAVDYCARRGARVCPFDAYCPRGPASVPYGGYQDGHPWPDCCSWAPVDGATGWVQLSSNSGQSCDLISTEDADFDGESVSRVMCCRDWEEPRAAAPGHVVEEVVSGPVAGGAAADGPEAAVAAAHAPAWFDRSDGWAGETHPEAEDFCADRFMRVCEYGSYCPRGMDGRPYGGARDGDGLSFAPIRSDEYGWVQVSSDGGQSCTVISSEAFGNEQQTRHVLCCRDPSGGGPQEVEETPAPESAEERVGEAFRPRWFNRMDGWVGDTHPQAEEFCRGRGLETCPYEAYCPSGPAGEPFGGPRGDDAPDEGGSWAPTSDAGGWVQVSSDGGTSCDLISSEGFGNEEQTRHIMCCEHFSP